MRTAKVTSAWRHYDGGESYEATALIPCPDGELVFLRARSEVVPETDAESHAQEYGEAVERKLREKVLARYPDVELVH
jgi:hypothetical protein